MKSPKELRIDQARLARSEAINRSIQSDAERIKELESEVWCYKIGIAVAGLAIGTAVIPAWFGC